MVTEVVQFRQAAEILAWLRARGINPNDFGREAFEAKVRQLETKEAMDRLARRAARRTPSGPELARGAREDLETRRR